MANKRVEIQEGQKFHKLTALSFNGYKDKKPAWLFKCECGKIKTYVANTVTNGRIWSCGCLRSFYWKKLK